MKKMILVIILTVFILLLLIPMPHGGTLGGNFVDHFRFEIKMYFSSQAKAQREKEAKEWKLQKDEAKKSWDKAFPEQNES